MSIQEFNRSDAEHEARRRLTSEWFDLQPHKRRTLLQTLHLSDFVALCHVLAEQRRYLTPDLAYAHLRSVIEPEPWAPDIVRDETWASGAHYVFWFGGRPVCARPVAANQEGMPADMALYETARQFFATCYPRHLHLVLTEEIWKAPNAA